MTESTNPSTTGRFPLRKLDQQISTLQDRLQQLKIRQQRIEVRQRALDAQRRRKAETRRRILVGTVVLMRANDGRLDQTALRQWLDEALSHTADRALFDLPPHSGSQVPGTGPLSKA